MVSLFIVIYIGSACAMDSGNPFQRSDAADGDRDSRRDEDGEEDEPLVVLQVNETDKPAVQALSQPVDGFFRRMFAKKPQLAPLTSLQQHKQQTPQQHAVQNSQVQAGVGAQTGQDDRLEEASPVLSAREPLFLHPRAEWIWWIVLTMWLRDVLRAGFISGSVAEVLVATVTAVCVLLAYSLHSRTNLQ